MFAAGRSDIGKMRSKNQDTIFCSTQPVGPLPNLFIVADGMGGHNAGEVASRQAVELFCAYMRGQNSYDTANGFLDLLITAANQANQTVFNHSTADPALGGMGTTFTACVIKENKCEFVHIGDSRAYAVTKEQIVQVTTDHSYVNEMVKAGQLTESQAREHPRRNVLTRVLGVDPDMCADGYIHKLTLDSTLLLCSDGLTNMIPDGLIHTTLINDKTVDERAESLINLANERGGNDNISVVIIDYKV